MRRTRDAKSILAERLRRQGLAKPIASVAKLPELLRALQPVSTGPYARPGSPPRLVHRTRFDDARATDRLRRDRRIVKGRFQGGGVGYVLADDLALYANAFARPLRRPSAAQRSVLEAIRAGGPLTPRQLKDETGLLHKQIMPALNRLQEAFLVYEDQVDDDWERGFYDLASEWPGACVSEERREAAAAEVLARFAHAHVFATPEQLRDWSRLTAKDAVRLAACLEREGRLVPQRVPGLGEGWLAPDAEALSARAPAGGVFMLHKQDFLSRSHASELERRFGTRDVLQYLLIDGELRGCVYGHWRFRPYDVDDVAVELPARERDRRRAEILRAVLLDYRLPRHPIRKYAGKPVSSRTLASLAG